jgi:hypothetical protein
MIIVLAFGGVLANKLLLAFVGVLTNKLLLLINSPLLVFPPTNYYYSPTNNYELRYHA